MVRNDILKAIIDKEYIFKVIYVAAVSDIDNTNSIKYLWNLTK